ncbi:MAG TPA: A24 family peptidase [Acidimicrobiales bacterium]|nr:A24 family peptidase [Acidimicrobiales bacterium]
MNGALVAGCAAAGVVVGALLDSVVVSVPPPPRRDDPDAVADPLPPWRFERVVVAVLTGLALGLAAARLGAVPELAAYCVFIAGSIALAVVDVRIWLVPRKILYPTFALTAVGLLAASAVDDNWTAVVHGAIAGVVALAAFFALWWFLPRAMGFGDVRMAGMVGAGLGWLGFGVAYLGFLAAFLFGSVLGIVLMVRRRTGRKTKLPFGTGLAFGAVVGVLWGPWLANLWLHHGT